MSSSKIRSQTGAAAIPIIVLILGVVALLSLVLWFFEMGGGYITRTIDYVVTSIVAASGWSYYLTKGVIVLASIPFFWAVANYTKVGLWHKPLRPSLRLYTNRYGLVIVSYVGLFFVSMYFASLDAFAFKYCAVTPEGIRVFDSPIRDPVYGIESKPCTREQIMVLRRSQGKLAGPQVIAPVDPRTMMFFDELTGEPLVWYYRAQDGAFELFDSPGIHPGTGSTLIPVTSDLVSIITAVYDEEQRLVADLRQQALEDSLQESRLERLGQYIDVGVRNNSSLEEVAVVVVNRTTAKSDAEFERLIAEGLRANGKHAVLGFIRAQFIDELFESVFTGGVSNVREMALQDFVDKLIIGRSIVTYTSSSELANLKTAIVTLEWRRIDLTTGSFEILTTIEMRGAGFDEEASLRNAIEVGKTRVESTLMQL